VRAHSRTLEALRDALIASATPIATLVLWEWAGSAQVSPSYLSQPSAIWRAFLGLVGTGEYAGATLISLQRAYAGFALGASIGVALGLLAAMRKPVREFLDPIVSFLYPVPKIAFLPVLLLTFGIDDGSKVALIALSVFFPLFLSARQSLAAVDKNIVWAARNMGARSAILFYRVLLPAIRPQLFAGARIGLALAFIVLFAAEIIGSRDGLGHLISEAENNVQFDAMLAGIAGFMALGFINDRILLSVRSWLLRGQLMGTEEGAH
jgi:ABC-type nitrate/sulfonate/bicarbonate transport system permease component